MTDFTPESSTPTTGDLVVCFRCAVVSVATEAGELRYPTMTEWQKWQKEKPEMLAKLAQTQQKAIEFVREKARWN